MTMNGDKINILLVDDKPENLLTLEAIIEQDDYHIIKANSGEEALKYLLIFEFALILLDVHMSGLDGFGTAKIIKAREKTKNIPILFISAHYLDPDYMMTGYSIGANDYLIKPIDPAIIKAKVDNYVNIYRMQQKLTKQTKLLEEKNKVIEYMVYHDSLTELPNRRYFLNKLNESLLKAKQSYRTFAMLTYDIDKFKSINDVLGYLTGDRILQEVGKRLKNSVREIDFIARTGGDEFKIILPDTNREEAILAAKKILETMKEPFYIDNYELFITGCIGMTVFPYDGEDSVILMKNTDAALNRAKQIGVQTYQEFRSEINFQAYRAFTLKNDLRKAMQQNELEILYKPRYSLENGNISSLEAKLHWHHPNWGIIAYSECMQLAEEIGYATDICHWMVKKVCSQLKFWQNAGESIMPVSIKFSVQQLLHKQLVETIKQILKETNVSSKLLEIEISDEGIVENKTLVTRVITDLRKMGITITISCCGFRYHSLDYLKNHPVNKFKIDKVFVHELAEIPSNQTPPIAAVIALAHLLNMTVIVEGVETIDQAKRLKELKCQEIQGPFVSIPFFPEQLKEMMHKFNNDYLNVKDTVKDRNNRTLHENVPSTFSENAEIDQNEEIIRAALLSIKEKYSISAREMDVFTLIVSGLNNKKISEKLFISEHTVKNHITSILQKLNVNDRLQAMAIVYQVCLEKGKDVLKQTRQ